MAGQPAFLRQDGAWFTQALWFGLWILLLLAVSSLWKQSTPATPFSLHPLLALGVLGMWRHGWGALHWIRAAFYLHSVYPALRRKTERLKGKPALPLYCLVTSFQTPPVIFRACFQSLLKEAAACPAPVTIVASVTNAAEQDTLEYWYHQMRTPSHVRLWLQQQSGNGKREALAEGLRAIARDLPDPRALVALMDGDTVLPAGTLLKSTRLFQALPWLGAASTNNRAMVSNGNPVLGAWYDLRLAQRHIYMASMALSRRLLVLTGRFSLLRAGYATHPSFVEQVEHDSVPHWRFGSLPLVTGDDKSTWFWLLKRKVPMLYLPDVTVWSLETPAATSFIAHSVQMMRRWFGNMLRTSGRALKLGTRTVPVFTWFSLLDQRVSMWTSLAAPAAVGLMTALQGNKTVLYGYLLWVLVSRFVYALLLGISQGRLRSVWPFLLYWNQIAGSLVKIHTLFHLARQHWNRQRVRGLLPEPEQKYIGNVFEVTAMLTFVYWVALMVGLADAPGF